MNKKEAAEFLGCSERAIERYVKAGKISCRYEKGKTRSIAIFDQPELERFKNEGEAIRPAFEVYEEPRQTTTVEQSGLAILEDEPVGIVGVDDISRLSAMVELLLNGNQLKPNEKLVLTIDECHQLTGFPREMIRSAIASGQLLGKKIGKSWRVQRVNLEAYINEVMS
ncbi:helix-turn-helix domain-containing protein [Anabaena cylindrica UHCC 0172]|uniref:helix-turn-helix domain-containing protein n=1 Tax=Anabaena cylindrica TaxID=1165 RepID=UPI002B21D608|nr:helix-turn-helix domain-containing protein [Anabaena cylindrica]MEA5554391.1 helix-turn-helix domain-containing protein [Anabaena cylindrica UHCC 0172]